MMRVSSILALTMCFAAGAYAQTQSNAPASNRVFPEPGHYSGTLNAEKGKATSQVKMTIRDVTADGRVTATVQASHARAACAARLPMNGLVLPGGEMRLEVNDGAPEGCERIYHIKSASGGKVSGTYIDAMRVAGGKLAERSNRK